MGRRKGNNSLSAEQIDYCNGRRQLLDCNPICIPTDLTAKLQLERKRARFGEKNWKRFAQRRPAVSAKFRLPAQCPPIFFFSSKCLPPVAVSHCAARGVDSDDVRHQILTLRTVHINQTDMKFLDLEQLELSRFDKNCKNCTILKLSSRLPWPANLSLSRTAQLYSCRGLVEYRALQSTDLHFKCGAAVCDIVMVPFM